MNKKIFSFFDAAGDLQKRWFIEWKEGIHRRRKYITGDTAEIRYERYELALKEAGATNPKAQKWWLNEKKRIEKFLSDNHPIWRKKTYQSTQAKFRQLEEFADVQPADNIVVLMQTFFLHLRQSRKPSTHNDYLVLCARLWKMPTELKPLTANCTPARYFTNSQTAFLSKEISQRDPELWLFVQFIFYCFIRPQELRFLTVGDVILEEQKIVISGSISKNKKEQYVVIPAAFFPIVEAKILGRNPTEYLFLSSSKSHLSTNVMSNRHQKILKELNFDTNKHKLYSWKHTGAVMATKAGIHIKQLQVQLRHHSLDQVDMYLRQLGQNDLDELAAKFPKI